MHVLYRFYNADGDLLYVGITNNPPRRFSKHRADKDWWLDVTRIEMEHHGSRDQLLDAERDAIREELPRHNIVHARSEALAPRRITRSLRVGEVYALCLRGGECPVGLVIDGDEDGVTIALYSWMLHRFTAGEEWISGDEIIRYLRAEKTINGKHTSFEMDALGDYQEDWARWLEAYKRSLA